MTITAAQNKQLHTLLSLTKQLHLKANLVAGFTGGRTESSRELHQYEAMELIKHLQAQANRQDTAQAKAANQMRRKLIAMAREIGWEAPPSPPAGGERAPLKADMPRINNWCKQYGYLHKALNDYTYQELPALLSQFEKGPYLSHLKNKS